MSNNPFSSVVKNSLHRVDSVVKAARDLEEYLVKASEALNDTITGPQTIYLTSDDAKSTARFNAFLSFIDNTNGVDKNTNKNISICNGLTGELVARWKVNKEATEMTITIGKVVNIYPVNETGYINAISDILESSEVMTQAVKLRNSTTI
ncbi:MAG: hypothetical protein E7F77_04370 [Serratia marcescens]|uniref:hypothetical protein n=1 Tax=Serratia marcescens TaxID=615 RepID=UPI002178A836|nr:hypothetical protein [Serratia marcescens]MDU3570044.1 hypothetical protein [Serratia marcescens]MDU3648345.1 hypothetical protein [Serratia marcescens]CAI0809622.1 Uncharacterised protein [Serratia marcescens]CAI1575058.1 Uncharacterised protein [Serratia marcescens]